MSRNSIKNILFESDNLKSYKNQRVDSKDKILNDIQKRRLQKGFSFSMPIFQKFTFLALVFIVIVFVSVNLFNSLNVNQDVLYIDSVLVELENNDTEVRSNDFEIDTSALEY